MSILDKVFVRTWDEYQKFLKWAENKVYQCPNGSIIKVIDFVYTEWTESDFVKNNGVYFAYTTRELDYFLIKDCPFDWFQEWLKLVYDEDYYNSVLSGTSHFDKFMIKDYQMANKVRVIYPNQARKVNKPSRFRFSNGSKTKSFLTCQVTIGGKNLKYDSQINRFLLPNELGDGKWENLKHIGVIRSVKALVRRFLKMGLPKGAVMTSRDIYGECFTLKFY